MSVSNSGAPRPLFKQNSWSPDILREEAWTNRRKNNRLRRTRSVTDDDLEELRACFDLGFSPDLDPKLSSTFPALNLINSVSGSSSPSFSDKSIIDSGKDPEMVKTRLKQWAQVVACSVRQFS